MEIGNKLFRSSLLMLAGNRAVESLALKYGMRLGAEKFVAGETLEEALEQVRRLNAKGIAATLDHLGEGVRHEEEADAYRSEYGRLIAALRESKVQANLSVKPTQMGLALDRKACYARIRGLVASAREFGCFVCLDMENSPYTDATIDIMRRLHEEGLGNVGTVLQASLYRTHIDIRRLRTYTLRLVKGAYREPKSIAYPRKADVDAGYKRMVALRLRSRISYTAVATHDESVIDMVKALVAKERIPLGTFEFQMLYGVRTPLQEQLAREGYKVRCYVPYGRMWYPYFVRRLAERPANLWFVAKTMLRGSS